MAVQTVVVTQQIDPARVEACYYEFMIAFKDGNFNAAEVSAAAAVFLGTQWNCGVMNEDQTKCFIKDLMDWMAAYFVKGAVQ